MICALWEKLSKSAFKKAQAQQKSTNCCNNDKEKDVNILQDNNADISSVQFYKPKVVYKSSRKLKKSSKTRICASCGQIRSKKNFYE